MTRSIEWYLDTGTEPVPGDPDTVAAVGQEYGDVAQAIRTAASRLEAIAAAAAEGGADFLEAIREKATTVAQDVGKAEERYDETGAALVTYAGALRDAQREASAALQKAGGARQAVHEAQARRDQYSDPAVQESLPDAVTRVQLAEDDLAGAQGALQAAQSDLDEAVAARDSAARTAAAVVRGVIEADGLNDGWWQDVRGVVNAITDAVGKIAAVAGILALVLCWVPGLGQALAAIALIAGAISFIGETLKLVNGEGDWVSWGLGLLGLVTFGAGRVVGTTLKLGAKGVQGTARVRADALVRATRGSRGVRSAVRRMLGGRGIPGIKEGERAMDAFVARPGLWRITRDALAPRAVARGLWDDLRGFGQVAGFVRHPVVTWRSVVEGTAGLQRATALFGASAEARAISSIAAADDAVRAAPEVAGAVRYANASAAGLVGNSALAGTSEVYQRFRDVQQGKTDWLDFTPDSPADALNLR
ncbi:hypothetical protein [Puerhibacterium puerhi]|uniref:hypothetical protein n=1 Tax=Puerhibacterium puerhi TaxID=2692623 RepID=UPI001358A4D7|nr:hypothetical protein [Puerhibacterium puerhi]